MDPLLQLQLYNLFSPLHLNLARWLQLKLLNTDQGPTAVIGGNNRSSIAYIKVSRQLGKEIAYIGFDDFELADALGISVVSFDTFEMGQKAAKLAVNRINNPSAKPRQQKTPTVFISRGSEQVK